MKNIRKEKKYKPYFAKSQEEYRQKIIELKGLGLTSDVKLNSSIDKLQAEYLRLLVLKSNNES